MSPVNLDRIQSWIDQGRLDISQPITMKELNRSRCLHGVKRHGVKLLGKVRLHNFEQRHGVPISFFHRMHAQARGQQHLIRRIPLAA